VLRAHGAHAFTDEQMAFMSAFADQAAVGLHLANTAHRMRELDVLSDRDRIARDLHDQVIQQLFALGMSLQATIPRVHSPTAREHLNGIVDGMQDTITGIRRAIFDLHRDDQMTNRLRQRLDDVIAHCTADTALRTTVRMSGPLSVIPQALADHVEAVLREGLTNVVKHADACTVTVEISADDDVSIEIVDDGKGILDTPGRRSGLDNLADRAHANGGEFTLDTAESGGTRLHWSAPLI
jgi:signal transduction histidine kinase